MVSNRFPLAFFSKVRLPTEVKFVVERERESRHLRFWKSREVEIKFEIEKKKQKRREKYPIPRR